MLSLALTAIFHPHPQPALQTGQGLECAVAGGQEPASSVGKGIKKRLRGRQGRHWKMQSRTSNFLMFSGKKGGMGSSKSPWLLWLHILFKPAAEKSQLCLISGPTLFLSSHLIKVKIPPFCPRPHSHIFPWGQWTWEYGPRSLVAVGRFHSTWCCPLRSWDISVHHWLTSLSLCFPSNPRPRPSLALLGSSVWCYSHPSWLRCVAWR